MLLFDTYLDFTKENKGRHNSESRGRRAYVTILPKNRIGMFTLVTPSFLLGKA